MTVPMTKPSVIAPFAEPVVPTKTYDIPAFYYNKRTCYNNKIYTGPMRGTELPYKDGVPLESDWHLNAMMLLIHILAYCWRHRTDFYIGGNMFVYFDPYQRRRRNFRGPDFFVVKGVKKQHSRDSWVVWEEDMLTPDVVIELASPSTATFDVTDKKDIYEQILQTSNYFTYNPKTGELKGWELINIVYVALVPNAQGWLWSDELGLWIGVVDYYVEAFKQTVKVLRFFDSDGNMLPTREEAEAQRAEQAEMMLELKDKKTAHRMLAKGMNIALISEITGLSPDEIAKL